MDLHTEIFNSCGTELEYNRCLIIRQLSFRLRITVNNEKNYSRHNNNYVKVVLLDCDSVK